MPNKKTDTIFQITISLLILIPHLFIILAHQNIVLNWFNTDDAFYYFKTAQNIVEGQGITFDGIALTNGFHPLWMVLMLPIFTLASSDLVTPLRLVIALQVLLGMGSALVLYRFCRAICSRWVAFVLALVWAFTPTIYEVVFKGGTEAGLNAFFLMILWWTYYRVTEDLGQEKVEYGQILALGGVAALALLSRLDNVYLVFIAGGWLVVRFWRQPGVKTSTPVETFRWWLKLGAAYFTPLVVTLGSYMLLNQIYFNSAMPVSGKIKRWWGSLVYTVYGRPIRNLKDLIEEFFSPEDTVGPWAVVMAPLYRLSEWFSSLDTAAQWLWSSALLALLGLILWLIYRNRKFFVSTFWRWNLIPLLTACMVQIAYYKGFRHVAQKGWYWIPEMLFVVLFLGIILEILAREVRKLPQGEKIMAAAALILAVTILMPYAKYPTQVLQYVPPAEEQFYLMRAHWLEANTEPGTLIGMTGSGSSGYFVADRVIINLDGLINSQEYFEHLQNGTADQYLESIGLDYVFGNAYILQKSIPYKWNFENRLEEFRYLKLDDKTLTLFRFH